MAVIQEIKDESTENIARNLKFLESVSLIRKELDKSDKLNQSKSVNKAIYAKIAWQNAILPIKSQIMTVVIMNIMGVNGYFGIIMLLFNIFKAIKTLFVGDVKIFNELSKQSREKYTIQKIIYLISSVIMILTIILSAIRKDAILIYTPKVEKISNFDYAVHLVHKKI